MIKYTADQMAEILLQTKGRPTAAFGCGVDFAKPDIKDQYLAGGLSINNALNELSGLGFSEAQLGTLSVIFFETLAEALLERGLVSDDLDLHLDPQHPLGVHVNDAQEFLNDKHLFAAAFLETFIVFLRSNIKSAASNDPTLLCHSHSSQFDPSMN